MECTLQSSCLGFFCCVNDVKYFTGNGGKMLLNYDGYSTNISICVILLLKENNLLVDDLPEHTNRNNHPLDVMGRRVQITIRCRRLFGKLDQCS